MQRAAPRLRVRRHRRRSCAALLRILRWRRTGAAPPGPLFSPAAPSASCIPVRRPARGPRAGRQAFPGRGPGLRHKTPPCETAGYRVRHSEPLRSTPRSMHYILRCTTHQTPLHRSTADFNILQHSTAQTSTIRAVLRCIRTLIPSVGASRCAREGRASMILSREPAIPIQPMHGRNLECFVRVSLLLSPSFVHHHHHHQWSLHTVCPFCHNHHMQVRLRLCYLHR